MASDLLRAFATALTFLTRIPYLARYSYPDGAGLARSLPYFPLVGALLAALSFGAYVLVWYLTSEQAIASVAALATATLMTGAFHEDGFADSCDGIGGGYTLERRLEIMRDSRIGSFAGVGLCLLLLTKFACLSALNVANVLPALLLAHVLSRFSVLPLSHALPYLRDGEKKPVADGPTLRRCLYGALLTALLMAPLLWSLGPWPLAGALGLCACLVLYSIHWLRRTLGGATGDLYGAVNQVIECAMLAYMVVVQAHGLG